METIKSYTSSSIIRTIEYFAIEQKLRVTFIKGSQYDYYNVPENIFEQALAAESIGQFFSLCIKDIYSYNKVS